MKKVFLHIAGILTAIFIIFTFGLFIGRVQNSNETIPSDTNTEHTAPSQNIESKININTATTDELCTLPGIGTTTANAIIDYRSKHGPFESIEQLLDIKGIGNAKFEVLIDLITLS